MESGIFNKLRNSTLAYILYAASSVLPVASGCIGGSNNNNSTTVQGDTGMTLEEAIQERMSHNNVYLTKWGNDSQYIGESDALLNTAKFLKNPSADYTYVFAELVVSKGMDEEKRYLKELGYSVDDWIGLFNNWVNGVVGQSPDDEISNTIKDGYGINFDFQNNLVRFYIETQNGEKSLTVYFSPDAMNEVRIVLEELLKDVYKQNNKQEYYSNGEQVLQSEFDPTL